MATPIQDTSKIALYYGAFRFWPAPLMTYAQQSVNTDGGERISDRVTLSFNGTLLNTDNPSSGDFSALVAKRDLLINALSGNNREFKILHHVNSTSASGTPIISGIYPRVENLSFNEGLWVDTILYSFDLVYETNYASGTVPVESFTDSWDFEEDENKRIIRATHSVSAKGINTTISGGASNAMQNAKTWVVARMGVDTIPSGLPGFCASGDLQTTQKLQKYRTESASIIDGTFSAREEITLSSGVFANSYTLQYQENEDGIVTISINGDVEGFGRFQEASNRAVTGWKNSIQPILSGIAYSGYVELGGNRTLNISGIQSLSITNDIYNGRVGYSATYNDDPQDAVPSGISEISITKQTKLPIRKIATFEIPSRILGSIIHDIGTPTDGQISINGTVQGTVDTQMVYVKQVAEDEVNSIRPNPALYTELWIEDISTTENTDQNSFSFSISYGYTDSLSNVPNPSGDISF